MIVATIDRVNEVYRYRATILRDGEEVLDHCDDFYLFTRIWCWWNVRRVKRGLDARQVYYKEYK